LHIVNRVGGRSGPSSVESTKTPDCQHKGMQSTFPPTRMPTQYRYQRNSMICELLFPSSILAVKLNRKSLVIVLEMEIYIYDISNMRLLHVIETSPNPEGVLSINSPSQSLLNIMGSYMRSITISRQLLLGISLPCTLTHIPADQRRNHLIIHPILRLRPHLILLLPSPSIRRRPPLLHTLTHRIQRHPRPQIPPRLPRAQLHRHPPRHVLRKGDRDPRMECPRRGEAVSIPEGDKGGEDLVDEF
jgi:hypothetical protein